MRNYSYNEDSNVFELRAEGDIYIKDLINHYKKLSESHNLNKELKVLIDCRNAIFNIDVKEIELVFKDLENAVNKFNSISEAIIVDNPYKTVIATLFKRIANLKNYSFKIFSTETAAKAWLNF